MAAFASPAAAAPGDTFSCRASAVRVELLNTKIEPFVANDQDVPCVTDEAGLINPTDVLGLTRLSVASARTFANPSGIPGTYAETEVADVKLPVPGESTPLAALPGLLPGDLISGLLPDLPLAGLLPAIHAEVLNTKAGVSCVGGQPVFYSDSKVVRLQIGDTVIEIPADGKPFEIDLGIAKVFVNENITTPTSVTRRALRVTSPLLDLDVVVAESSANVEGNPCGPANPPPGPGNPPPGPGNPPPGPVNPPPHANKPACSDGKDNDKDGKVDSKDPGCRSKGNNKYNPNDNNEYNKPKKCKGKKNGHSKKSAKKCSKKASSKK